MRCTVSAGYAIGRERIPESRAQCPALVDEWISCSARAARPSARRRGRPPLVSDHHAPLLLVLRVKFLPLFLRSLTRQVPTLRLSRRALAPGARAAGMIAVM